MSRTLTVTLPDDLASLVESKVASGAFVDESDVVRESLELLREDERELEDWLREVGVPALDRLKADPSRARTMDQVRESLAEAHRLASARQAT